MTNLIKIEENLRSPDASVRQKQASVLISYQSKEKRFNPNFRQTIQSAWQEYYNEKKAIKLKQDTQLKQGKVIKLNKYSMPFEKKVVTSILSFVYGAPTNVWNENPESPDEIFAEFQQYIKLSNDYALMQEFAKILAIEKESAIIYYLSESKDKNRPLIIKGRQLCRLHGDNYNAFLDENKTLLAFVNQYNVLDEEGKETAITEIYTENYIFKFDLNFNPLPILTEKGEFPSPVQNLYGMIPVIYSIAEETAWQGAREIIDRIEESLNATADNNNANSYPTPVLKTAGSVPIDPTTGEANLSNIVSLGDRRDPNKLLILQNGTEASYLESKNSIDGVKYENDTLFAQYFNFTGVPQLDIEKMRGAGNMAKAAVELILGNTQVTLIPTKTLHIQANTQKYELFKKMIAVATGDSRFLDLQINFELQSFIKENLETLTKAITTLSDAGVISKETASAQVPFVTDASAEMEKISAEADSAQQSIEKNRINAINTGF